MSRFAPKTLRRMPPATREIARLANDLASVQTRLANRIDGLVSMEMMAGASRAGVLQQRRPRRAGESRAALPEGD